MSTTSQTAALRDALLGLGVERSAFRVRVTERPRGVYHESIAYFTDHELERRIAEELSDELVAAGVRVQRFWRAGELVVAVLSYHYGTGLLLTDVALDEEAD